MNYLLDTHSFLWFIGGNDKLSAQARQTIENTNHSIFLSMASVWEMGIKSSIGKLKLTENFEKSIVEPIHDNAFEILDIALPHIISLQSLPWHHRDPFDRLLISQSHVEKLPLISADALFDPYGVQRIW